MLNIILNIINFFIKEKINVENHNINIIDIIYIKCEEGRYKIDNIDNIDNIDKIDKIDKKYKINNYNIQISNEII